MTTVSPVALPPVAIVGAGAMGRAILQGLLAPHVSVAEGIRITNRRVESVADMPVDPRVTSWVTSVDPEANRKAVTGAAVVIVAVKPADVEHLLAEVGDSLDHRAVVVSVAAGKTLAQLEGALRGNEGALPGNVAVARAMPNTPAQIRRGVTGLAFGSSVTPEQASLCESVFATVGSVVVVDEPRLNALTSISGSGPAYVFYLIEELEKAAMAKGFTHAEAALLVRETFRGASELVIASGEQPGELRRKVTSPQGTTERAIHVLEQADLAGLFARATEAAMARAREISGS